MTKPTVLGGIVTFSSFIPDEDICAFEGNSYLYALYYKTGTAYCEGVFAGDDAYGDDTMEVEGEDIKEINRKVDLGHGLAATPSLHVGKEEGAKAFVQSSPGEILVINEENLPAAYKSRPTYWLQPGE